jgi:uncharacterized membrane protein
MPASPVPSPVQGNASHPQVKRTNGLAITSMVLGIIGFFTVLPSIVAIVFGAVALGQIGKDQRQEGRGLAVAGLVMGIVSIVFWILVVGLAIIGAIATTSTSFG